MGLLGTAGARPGASYYSAPMSLTLDEMPDALLILSFGGPAGPDEVMPFLRSVVKGAAVPEARLQEVAARYQRVGGRSPIVDATEALVSAVHTHLASDGPALPVYLATRNWTPSLVDTLAQMRDDGVRRALVFVTSAFSSWSACRQYLEAIGAAWTAVPGAPRVDKIRGFWNHPGFLDAVGARVREVRPEGDCLLLFTAHSLPTAQAAGCAYEEQLREAARIVAEDLGGLDWDLAWQSRSGPPSVPWLAPDVCDRLTALAEEGEDRPIVLVPLGFVADHMEVVWDLDVEAADRAAELGLTVHRAATVGTHPAFVTMVGDLVRERFGPQRPVRGRLPALPDVCAASCCPPGR